MAANLVAAGYEVYGLNRSKGKEQAFIAAGGKAGYTLDELVRKADVVMTCLPMPADVEHVYLGPEGVLAAGRPGQILIDFSTVAPELSRRLAEAAGTRGMRFLDAPVSGGTTGAREGTLTVMVGGDRAAFDQVKSLLDTVGSHTHYIGPSGSGAVVKLLNQLMVGVHTQAVSEAFRLAEQAGVELPTLYELLSKSFAQSRIMDRHYVQYMAASRYEAGFALRLLHKDMRLVKDMANAYASPVPLAAEVLEILHKVGETDFAELDMAGLYAYHTRQEGETARLSPAPRESEANRRYFAVLLPMKDEEKSRIFRPQHLAYLEAMRVQNRIFVNGRFVDGSGGMVIYKAASEDEARSFAENDPYVRQGARSYEIHEWDLVLG